MRESHRRVVKAKIENIRNPGNRRRKNDDAIRPVLQILIRAVRLVAVAAAARQVKMKGHVNEGKS